MFCKYCGRQLQEGEVCSCQMETSQSQEPANQPQPQIQGQQTQFQGQTAQKKPSQEAMNKALELLKGFWKRPLEALDEAYAEGSVTAQLYLGILYPVAIFLFILILIMRVGALLDLGFGAAFGPALGMAVFAAAIKAVHIAASYLKSDKSKSFQAVAGVYCLAALPETACYLLLAVLSLLGTSALSVVFTLLLVTLFVGGVSNFTACQTVFAGKRSNGYWINLLVTLIVVIVGLLIMRTIIVNMITDIIQNIMYSSFF